MGGCIRVGRNGDVSDHVHRSDGRQVPVTQHWWCHDMEGSGADLRCTTDDGIVAFLTMADDDGIVEVVLQHGDMEMPHIRLADAAELAGHLLELVQAAR